MQVLRWQKMSIYQFKGGMANSNIERFGRFGLFISYFLVCLYYVCYVFVCFFSYLFIFVVAATEREVWVLSFYCIVSFYLLVGGVRGLSSAGQSVTYISILLNLEVGGRVWV